MALKNIIMDMILGKTRVSVSTVRALGRAVWSKRDLKAFAKEGYQSNVVVFRCVDVIAKSLASIPLKVKQGGEIAGDEHPLVQLLKRPNPRMTKARLVHNFAAFKLIAGNAWLEKIGPDGRPPRELWIWPPYSMKPVIGKVSPIPVGYEFDNGQLMAAWEVDPIDGRSDMLHWLTFNPLDPWIGMSPIESMAKSVDQRNAADSWNQALLQNSAAPSGLLSQKSTVTDSQLKQLRKQLDEGHTGPQRAGRPLIGGDSMSWTQMGMSPRDMNWLEGKNVASRDICSAYGVPNQIAGIQGDQTFANMETARLMLWEDTVIPLGFELVDELNHWFAVDFPGSEIFMDLDKIPALAPRRAAVFDMAQKSTFLSTNEKRKAVDRDPTEPEQGDGDQILVPGASVTLGDVTGDGGEEPRQPTTAGRNRLNDHKTNGKTNGKVKP